MPIDGAAAARPAAPSAAWPSRVSAVSFFSVLTTGAASSDQRLPRHHAGEHHRDADVEHGADDQRGDDADGHIALRILALFAGGRDRIEADVGEENDGAAGEHAATSRWARTDASCPGG